MIAGGEDVLIEHVLESETNLEIALDVAMAFETIRYRIIGEAIRDLKERLLASSRGDDLLLGTSFGEKPIPAGASFWVQVRGWPPNYSVGFHSDPRDAKQLYMGVNHGDAPLLPLDKVHSQLAELRAGNATPQHGWIWWYWLEEPLTSWTTKEALLALYSGEAVDTLAKQILEIVDAVHPLLESERHR